MFYKFKLKNYFVYFWQIKPEKPEYIYIYNLLVQTAERIENIILTVAICNAITAIYMPIEDSDQNQLLDGDVYIDICIQVYMYIGLYAQV